MVVPLLPGSTIGVVGGGQLGRMLAQVALCVPLVLATFTLELGEHTFQRYLEAKRQEWDEYRIQVTDPGHFYGIGEYEDAFPSVPLLASYKSSNAALLALWLPWIPQETIGEFASVALDVASEFSDPVLLDLLTGDIYVLEDYTSSDGMTQFANLPLADYPIVIAERSEISV